MHAYISDDRSDGHDRAAVDHAFDLHAKWMKEIGISPKQHWVRSDGCSAQFKGHRAFRHIGRYPSLYDGIQFTWNFFCSGHGKGEHDGAGANLKNELRGEQKKHKGEACLDKCSSSNCLFQGNDVKGCVLQLAVQAKQSSTQVLVCC